MVYLGELDVESHLTFGISFVLLVLHLLFLFQTIKHRRRAYGLTYGLVVGIVASFLSGVRSIRPFFGLEGHSNVSLQLSLVLWGVTFFLIYLFFEGLANTPINNYRLTSVTILLIMVVTTHMGLVLLEGPTEADPYLNPIRDALWHWADLSNALLGISIFVFGFWVIFQGFRQTKERGIPLIQMVGSSLIILGFVIGFLIDFSFFITDISGFSPNNILEGFHGDFAKIVGILLFTISYLVEIDYLYRLPFPTPYILFFKTDSGLCLSVARSKGAESSHVDEDLVTGTITAIMTLLKEATGTKGTLRLISATDQAIIFSSTSEVTVAAITRRPTKFLQYSLDSALDMFQEQFREELLSSKPISRSDFRGAKEILSLAFPYLELDLS